MTESNLMESYMPKIIKYWVIITSKVFLRNLNVILDGIIPLNKTRKRDYVRASCLYRVHDLYSEM